MPGANYMGGKRNAAKARAKDSTGRIQKGFFGRRRLDLLSKGITNNSREPSYYEFYANGKGSKLMSSSINLAHSKQTAEISSHHDESSFIPSPTRFPPSTPITRKSGSRVRQQCSSRSSSSQRSKVIDALDTSDPISLRATMDRILSLPDLAGLSAFKFRTPPRSHTTPRGTKRPRRRAEWEPSSGGEYKRQKKTCNSKESEPRIRSIGKQNRLASRSPISSESISDTIQERVHISDSRSRSGVRRDADLQNSADHEGYWGDPCDSDVEQDGDLSCSDFETGLEDHSNELRDCMQSPAAEDASQHRPQYSSSSIVHSESLDSIFWPEHYSVGSQSVSSRPGISRENPSAGHGQITSSRCSGNDATKDDLPTASANALSFSSNNLYEHEDPWHTIGVLLGLSPISQGRSYTHVHEQTSSALHSPRSWQDEEQEHKPLSSHAGGSLASERDLCAYSSSPRGSSSSISGGRLDLDEDGKLLCSPYGHASPPREARLNLTDGKSSEKTTLHFDHSPFSRVRSFSSRSGSDRSVKVMCDKENPERPLRVDLPSSSDMNSLVSSSVHAPTERSNLLSRNTPNNSSGGIRYSERCTEEEPINYYDIPLFAAGTTTAPLKELFASFEMNLEEVDGVFRGPCLFGEDGSDLDE